MARRSDPFLIATLPGRRFKLSAPLPEILFLLPELEVCNVNTAIVQYDGQLTAGSRPGAICLPDIDVLVTSSIIAETALASRVGWRFSSWSAVVARILTRRRVAGSENIQSFISAQAELDRNSPASIGCIDHWRVANGREEAREIVKHRHRKATGACVTRGISRRRVDRGGADGED